MIYTFYKQWGNSIFYSYIGDKGLTHHTKVQDYKPKLFIRSDGPSEYKSIFGYNVKLVEFDDISTAKKFYDQYSKVDGFVLEGNLKFANQFNIELNEGKEPDHSLYNIRGCILDIEVSAPEFPAPELAAYPIDAITLYDTISKTFTVYGLGDYKHSVKELPSTDGFKVIYTKCVNEIQLLDYIIKYFETNSYHYVSGWNSSTFDIPYIINRLRSQCGEKQAKKLSPYGMINQRDVFNGYKTTTQYEIVGLPHLDYMQLYQKHIYIPRESYGLGFIAKEELGDDKMSYEEEGSLSSLSKNNFQKYIAYNIKDVDIIRRLDDKLSLFNLTLTIAYYTLSNYEDTLGTVRLWEQLIAKDLYSRGIAALCTKQSSSHREYPGGFVAEPIVGHHRWSVSIDLNSLYPHLEMQLNISPETYVLPKDIPPELKQLQTTLAVKDPTKYYNQVGPLVNKSVCLDALKKYNYSMSAAGHFYRKDIKGIVPTIKEEIYTNRKKAKKKMLEAEQKLSDIKDELTVRGLI